MSNAVLFMQRGEVDFKLSKCSLIKNGLSGACRGGSDFCPTTTEIVVDKMWIVRRIDYKTVDLLVGYCITPGKAALPISEPMQETITASAGIQAVTTV